MCYPRIKIVVAMGVVAGSQNATEWAMCSSVKCELKKLSKSFEKILKIF